MPSQQKTVFESADSIGEGDSFLVPDFLPPELSEHAFQCVRDEVKWHRMVHRGGEVPRLVAVQGFVHEDGSYPIYRHPADESPPLLPFSPTVELIRQHVEETLHHPVNHVLIQHYRTGADYISEHSDKTIDVVRGSNIVNVSLGARRVMTLRTKKDAHRASADASEGRASQRIPLPHNSMFVMGLETNMRWLHGIRTDKRPEKTKSAEERFANGERISLTFRHIGTFLTLGDTHIYGQGARGKTREGAQPVVRGGSEAQALIDAFGRENHSSEFDWDAAYGVGSDVLHFSERADAL
ncbi:uncharacterized protein C8Q71DRAFT_514827 [Rhodofomes roseus]|uniref:Fe2OG dioxygenase domain-containing protein n=1 Tax=Rhodofomes roseus TaxID=34475 RepID=A0A4Y9Z1V7_9APHY|nr:uncharacterized protein C8Q71DRAFT_514827 [Rhodofomes roseus]KAH9839501.1 hypothetical protein C8Q71DRAFT_514827 [Rhodofomes roseus]TFY67908.1 hypothetical protein EVJ58_g1317 [Rhodofomes roseus]